MPGCRSPWALEDDHFGAALTTSAMAAPMILDGVIDGEMFTADVAHVLLKERRPGDGVVIDNLPAHKVAAVRQIIESAFPMAHPPTKDEAQNVNSGNPQSIHPSMETL